MSTSLVRKGLELFADDAELRPVSDNEPRKGKKRRPSSMKKEDLMKTINTNRKGVKKQLNRITHKEIRQPTAKEGKLKSAIENYLKSTPTDSTKANVQLLLSLSRGSPDTSQNYNKILEHSRRRSAKKSQPAKDKEKSRFSEEDFELFEKEYMPKKRNFIL